MTTEESTTQAPEATSASTKVEELRKRLGYTQDVFAQKCGERSWFISKIENGKNKATTTRAMLALAKGASVTAIQMIDYLRGALTLDELLAGRAGGA